jgi:hypothetical protein
MDAIQVCCEDNCCSVINEHVRQVKPDKIKEIIDDNYVTHIQVNLKCSKCIYFGNYIQGHNYILKKTYDEILNKTCDETFKIINLNFLNNYGKLRVAIIYNKVQISIKKLYRYYLTTWISVDFLEHIKEGCIIKFINGVSEDDLYELKEKLQDKSLVMQMNRLVLSMTSTKTYYTLARYNTLTKPAIS